MREVFSERQLHWSMYKLNAESWCLSASPSSKKEGRKIRQRVLGSQWMFSYLQILLGNCEANYMYNNFSNCFPCRITDQKIMKTWMEKKPLCFFQLWAAWRRYWLFQEAAAELLQAPSNPQEVLNNPTKHQNNIPQALSFPKAPAGDTKGHLEDTGMTVGRGSLTHPLILSTDRPWPACGNQAPVKINSRGIPGYFLDSKPGKSGKPTPSTLFQTIPGDCGCWGSLVYAVNAF